MRRSQPKFARVLAVLPWLAFAHTGPAMPSGRDAQLPFRIDPIKSQTFTESPSSVLEQVTPNREIHSPEASSTRLPFAAMPPATPATPRDTVSTLPGNQLLAEAVANIGSHRSIAANIRHRVNLFGHELVGSGTYQQMDIGPDRLLRLELKIPLDDQITSVSQICDGRRLWTERTFPDEDGASQSEIHRVDLSRLRRTASTHSESRGDPGHGTANRSAMGMRVGNGLLIGQGGLPQLMIELDRHFAFHTVDATTLHDVPVWITWGTWKPESLASMLADAGEEQEVAPQPSSNSPRDGTPEVTKLPAHFPDYVGVVLGQEDLLPYQFQYRRKNAADRIDASPVVPSDSNSTAIVTMELFQVEVGGAIDPAQFTFSPTHASNRRVIDRTRDYLKD